MPDHDGLPDGYDDWRQDDGEPGEPPTDAPDEGEWMNEDAGDEPRDDR